jgi:hypothetical protein
MAGGHAAESGHVENQRHLRSLAMTARAAPSQQREYRRNRSSESEMASEVEWRKKKKKTRWRSGEISGGENWCIEETRRRRRSENRRNVSWRLYWHHQPSSAASKAMTANQAKECRLNGEA